MARLSKTTDGCPKNQNTRNHFHPEFIFGFDKYIEILKCRLPCERHKVQLDGTKDFRHNLQDFNIHFTSL